MELRDTLISTIRRHFEWPESEGKPEDIADEILTLLHERAMSGILVLPWPPASGIETRSAPDPQGRGPKGESPTA